MPRFYVHGILLILLVSFCIFFGVDIATKGMENVQGPFAAVERAKARSQSVFAGPNADAASKGSSQAAAAVKAEAAIAEAAKAEAAKAEAAKAEAAKKARAAARGGSGRIGGEPHGQQDRGSVADFVLPRHPYRRIAVRRPNQLTAPPGACRGAARRCSDTMQEKREYPCRN